MKSAAPLVGTPKGVWLVRDPSQVVKEGGIKHVITISRQSTLSGTKQLGQDSVVMGGVVCHPSQGDIC